MNLISNKQQLQRRRSAGFTLIELLVVIAVIAALGAISYSQIMKRIRDSDRTKALKVIRDMEVAFDSFEVEEGVYPFIGSTQPDQDQVFITDTNAMLLLLSGKQAEGNGLNSRRHNYIAMDEAESDGSGGLFIGNDGTPKSLKDPRGNAYHFLVDYDEDRELGVSMINGVFGSKKVFNKVIVGASTGEDAIWDGPEGNDYFSWLQETTDQAQE